MPSSAWLTLPCPACLLVHCAVHSPAPPLPHPCLITLACSAHPPAHNTPPNCPQVRILKYLLTVESEADRDSLLAQAFEPGARSAAAASWMPSPAGGRCLAAGMPTPAGHQVTCMTDCLAAPLAVAPPLLLPLLQARSCRQGRSTTSRPLPPSCSTRLKTCWPCTTAAGGSSSREGAAAAAGAGAWRGMQPPS